MPDKLFAPAVLPALAALLLTAAGAAAELIVSEGTNLAIDVSPADQRIAMDLLGGIWILPPRGGDARRIADESQAAARPRWSPDGEKILYEATTASGPVIRLFDLATASVRDVGDDSAVDRDPDWHPDGQRIVFASERRGTGFDLWEKDLSSGVSWRLTQHPGDETEPAWSADGRNLLYVHSAQGEWRLVLRRHGRPETILVVSEQPLAAPAWRPDGSLATFLRQDGRRYALEMVILSDPPLVRTLAENQDFFLAPAVWVDRVRFLYTADGVIKSRSINEWAADEVDFRAAVTLPESRAVAALAARELPVITPPQNRIVIRARRIFDGRQAAYSDDTDILIEGGVIAEVGPRRDWTDTPVLDLGDATVLPGFIDTWSRLPEGDPRRSGPLLLSFGVTTLVGDGLAGFAAERWESEETPGPRLLRAAPLATADPASEPALVTVGGSGASPEDRTLAENWQARGVPVLAGSWAVGRQVGADLAVGSAALPVSPLGRRYEDLRMTAGGSPITRVSGLADGATPGVAELLVSRQAEALAPLPAPARRFVEPPALYGAASAIVAGSRPNGMPAGLALHAELRALTAAGLTGAEALQAAGRNPARLLGFQDRLGLIAPEAAADLVLVRGDPLARVEDALEIVAVVRNGRFYSLVRLLDMAAAADTVE